MPTRSTDEDNIKPDLSDLITLPEAAEISGLSISHLRGMFRGECLDRWVFADGREAQAVIEQWRQEYNHRRPHSSLGYLPPAVFADQARLTLDVV